ncbi:MAG: porin family protein [Rickettsiales bacterium]|jgi:opacity protein-like surface antigen|nr:porin family protein [Rickettsiales bacterium]
MKIKSIILYSLLSTLCVGAANAAIPYRAEQVRTPENSATEPGQRDSESLARERRFYVGGYYNFAMWQNDIITGNDNIGAYEVALNGKNTSSFEAVAGIRVYDTFRLEANYFRQIAEYDLLKITGNTVFLNALVDARIDNLYRMFHTQMLVPYVGFGAGLSWNQSDNATLENKISPAAGVLAGFGIEFNDRFALDLGYRYFYQFSSKPDGLNLAPISHQLRLGARLHF